MTSTNGEEEIKLQSNSFITSYPLLTRQINRRLTPQQRHSQLPFVVVIRKGSTPALVLPYNMLFLLLWLLISETILLKSIFSKWYRMNGNCSVFNHAKQRKTTSVIFYNCFLLYFCDNLCQQHIRKLQ